jgi:hypothetical protein
MKLAAAVAVIALAVPAAALADPLPEPAATVVQDCQDNGQLDTTYDLATIDRAESQTYHYQGSSTPWQDCGAMIDEAVQQALGTLAIPITDCMADGTLEGTYTQGQLDDATQNLPSLWAEFTSCKHTLSTAQPAAAKVSAARAHPAPSWVRSALSRRGAKIAHRKVHVRAALPRRHGGWYGQVRWPIARRGACYAEMTVPRHHPARVVGRYCTGRASSSSTRRASS